MISFDCRGVCACCVISTGTRMLRKISEVSAARCATSCRAVQQHVCFFHNLAPSCTFLSIVQPPYSVRWSQNIYNYIYFIYLYIIYIHIYKYIYVYMLYIYIFIYILYMRYMQFNIFTLAVYITMMVV